jgi:ankyrin repeat protein
MEELIMACSATNSCIGNLINNDIDLVKPIASSALQEMLDSINSRIVKLEQENRRLRGELKTADEYIGLTAKNWEFPTILEKAIEANNLRMIRYCICNLKGDINMKINDFSLLDLVIRNDKNPHLILNWFLSNPKLKINSVFNHGYSALHRACMKGNVYAVQALLKAGANPDLVVYVYLRKNKPIDLVDFNTNEGKEIINIFKMHQQEILWDSKKKASLELDINHEANLENSSLEFSTINS